MQTGVKFGLERFHNRSLDLNTVEADEGWRNYHYIIMGFTGWAGPGMTRMTGTIVDDIKVCRRERLRQNNIYSLKSVRWLWHIYFLSCSVRGDVRR